MKSITAVALAGFAAAAAFVVFVPSYTGPPRSGDELGRPQQVQFHTAAESLRSNLAPPPLPIVSASGRPAREVYRNVQVLGDLDAAEFMRLQAVITSWVAPQQGCGFCHVGGDYASDERPQKAVARVMLRMTRRVNTEWAPHVAPAGVTCYTCHRGQPVPAEIWFPSSPRRTRPAIGRQENWREAADTVRKFFPDDSYAEYLYDSEPLAVQSLTVGHSATVASQIETKRIYEVMMTMSDGIGVNCGFCHNSRNFASWGESTPHRWTGYDAIRQVRELNRNELREVAGLIPQTRTLENETNLPVLPAHERGAQTGNGLVLCGTCHTGLSKPLNGMAMVDAYPGLGGPLDNKAAR